MSLYWCNTLLEWQRKTITRDGCKEYTLTRNCKRVLREGLTLYRSSIAGACISPEAKQIIHDFKGCSWNSQTVRKSEESTVNTNQDKNKDR